MGTYVITGGASGIGAAIAKQLASEGNRVVTLDLREADIIADLATAEGRNAAIEQVREATRDGIAGLVTAAGLGSHTPNRALITRVNYAGSVELVEGLREHLAAHGAAVLLVSSNSAPMQTKAEFVEQLLEGDLDAACATAAEMPGSPVYSGTKQAVTVWMRRNAAAYAAEGVRMNAVGPGYTRTPMSDAIENDPTYGEAIKQFAASIPIGRPGDPQDIANAASFLLGERAGFICGVMLFVDGGHDAMLRPEQF